MNSEKIKSGIATIMQANGLLQLIDKYKQDERKSLNSILKEWEQGYKLNFNTHSFYNQYQFTTSLLYYIVLPKEEFYSKIPKICVKNLTDRWGIVEHDELYIRDFITRLRNSIVHGSFDISTELNFVFTDINKHAYSKKEDFICTFTAENLHKFVNSLAIWNLTEKT